MRNFSATRRAVLAGAVAAGATAAGVGARAAAQGGVERLYQGAMVIDALGGPGGSKGAGSATDQFLSARQVADAKASGVTAVNVTVSDVGNKPDAFATTVGNMAWVEREIEAHRDVFMRVRRADDLKAAKESGRVGLILGFQDLTPLDGSLDTLDVFHGLGLRIAQLAYNLRNIAGDGCLEPANGGLSNFGRSAIEKLNASKILIDGSHGGVRLIDEEIALSKTPMAVTHSGCRALNDVPRNIPDATMRALAQKGGVMGVYFMPFLRASGQPHAEDVLRHIEHALNVCGEDHVGIGTDGTLSGEAIEDKAYRAEHRKFVEERRKLGIAAPGESADVFNVIPEYNAPRRFETLAFDLSRRGHPDRVIEKILGGNFARLFSEVWG